MLLDKMIYKAIEDGAYTLTVKDWTLKSTGTDKPLEYVALSVTIAELKDRPLSINLFEQGLDIFASNIIKYFDLDEMTVSEALNFVVNKVIPGVQETKLVEETGKSYRNWYLARKDSEGGGF